MKNERSLRRVIGGVVFTIVLLAVNMEGQNLFVSAQVPLTSSGAIFELSTNGKQTTFASGLRGPAGLAFDSAGDLFAVVSRNSEIIKITPTGGQSTFASGLANPIGLAFDSAGNLYVAVSQNGTIVKISPGGAQSTFASGLDIPYGLAFDRAGDLFVANRGGDSITEITATGQSTFVSGLNAPMGLAFDSTGDLFEADSGSGNIYEFTNNNGTLSSNLTVFASGLGGTGLAFNSAGELFVASENEIVEVSRDQTQTLFASGPSGSLQLAFQPMPELQPAVTNGTFQMAITMPSPYYTAIVQTSTNLVNWFSICTSTPPFTLTDSMAASSRFYRAVLNTNSY